MDVQIIGAGTIGCYLARQLKDAGIDFKIFEEHSEVGIPKHCTGLVSKNIDELIKVPNKVVLNKVKGAKLYSPSGKCVELSREKDQAYVLDRPLFDKELSKGLDIQFNTHIEKLDTNAKFIVGADGANSTIARIASFPPLEKVITGVQVEIENESYDKKFVELYFGEKIAPGFFAWIVPTDKTLKVGLATKENPSEYLDRFIKERFGSPEILETYGGLIPLKWREQIVEGDVALVGDAAGQVKATSGGGVYIGMASAKILSDAIKENNLERYQKDWEEKIKPELNSALMIRNVLDRISDIELEKIFEILDQNEIKDIIIKYGDMDKPQDLLKKIVKNPAILTKFLPYLKYLW